MLSSARLLTLAAISLFGAVFASAAPNCGLLATGVQESQPQKPRYTLGPEDVVTLTVLNHPELSGDFEVGTDGMVQLPGVGSVDLEGLTLTQVEDKYVLLLKTNMNVGLLNPVVTAVLKTSRPNRVYVDGDVRAPGSFDLKTGWRITEALASAGGLRPLEFSPAPGSAGNTVPDYFGPGDYTVVVRHADGRPAQTLNLADVMKGMNGSNLKLVPGDNITINHKVLSTVYVGGDIAKPGVYQMRSDQANILDAIALAGGLANGGSLRNVVVRHANGKVVSVDLLQEGVGSIGKISPSLESGDLITIQETLAKVSVLGLVKQPGVVLLPETREYRLSDALAATNGFEQRARLGRVAIFQSPASGKSVRTVYNFAEYLHSGNIALNPVLHAGDIVFVPETNTPDFGTINSLVLFLLGTQGVFHF